jgi:hypothetical protein
MGRRRIHASHEISYARRAPDARERRVNWYSESANNLTWSCRHPALLPLKADHVLEESFACLLVNPAHVKQVPAARTRRRRLGAAGSGYALGQTPGSAPGAGGRFRPHHAFLASQLLAHLDYIDETIATVSEPIEAVIAPFAEELARLDTNPRSRAADAWRA